MPGATILAAIDLRESAGRVLYHAAAFARLLNAKLRVIHVNSDVSADARERVVELCQRLGPYEHDFSADEIVIRAGRVSDAITREARAAGASLLVIGSRGRPAVTTLLLGSTCQAVLKGATVPVLLVPPTDLDIVRVGDRVALTCGPVIAAVDLSDDAHAQLPLASRLAQLAAQPLHLMTVVKSRVTDQEATHALRDLAHGVSPVKPHGLIVRRGRIATEISRCAVVEGAGLVVMGVQAGRRTQPGAIAAAVLRTGRAFVLAVPHGRTAGVARTARKEGLALIASIVMMLAAGSLAGAQGGSPDVRAIVDFQRAADAYAFLHRQVELRLEIAHPDWQTTDPIAATELAAAIVAKRPSGAPLFTPRVVAAFRDMAAHAARSSGCDPGELRTGAWEMSHEPNAPATGSRPVAACIRDALPALPDELEYRSAGTVLLLVDTHANLVVDVLPALLAGSELRD